VEGQEVGRWRWAGGGRGDGWADGGGFHHLVSESGRVRMASTGWMESGRSAGTCPLWRTPPASRLEAYSVGTSGLQLQEL
jgi:hypothetical protein